MYMNMKQSRADEKFAERRVTFARLRNVHNANEVAPCGFIIENRFDRLDERNRPAGAPRRGSTVSKPRH